MAGKGGLSGSGRRAEPARTDSRAKAEWSNWAGNVRCTPMRRVSPATVEDLQALVADATSRGWHVRPAGAGHSFSPLCATEGIMVDVDRLAGVERIDGDRGMVTALAGTRIADLGLPLQRAGLALANQGDIDKQSLAGAIGTGTHGTGPRFGSFSSQVRAVEFVRADGSLAEVSATQNPQWRRASTLNLGVLGVLTRVTLALVPAYRLHERTWSTSWQECLESWPSTADGFRNAEFYWLPEHDRCVIKALEETADDPAPARRVRPAPPGTVQRYLTPSQVDWSWRVFPSERTVRFVEMEYALPAECGLAAMAELRTLMRTAHRKVTWAVEYRSQAGEDSLLSPTQGEPAATISVHDLADRPHGEFFRDAQSLFRSFGGRPHWGKLQSLARPGLLAAYPCLPQFEQVRGELDPTGTFLNDYLAAILRH